MGRLKNLGRRIVELFMGTDDLEQARKTTPQQLQEAVQRDIELANVKGETATAAMVAAGAQRKELAKLDAQYNALGRQALLAEKKGDQVKAQRVLALQLAIKERIDTATEQYESADNAAKQLISEARKTFKSAQEASRDLPKRVLQLEINSMMERAQKLEGDAAARLEGRQSYKALADSIDLTTARLTAQNLITDSSELGLDEEVDQVLKEAEFQEEYKKLQATAAESGAGDVIDAEIKVIEDDTLSRAQKLLTGPAFGGMIPGHRDSFTVTQPLKREIETVRVVATEAPDQEASSQAEGDDQGEKNEGE